ncbi:unnamed protein product (macronuclear) [Paramecium tetraurelia]|uniref:Uncharacterized protein n=1 Tax=Paramecium tetraurelia TaxID=5888 RepID=A0DUM6_PARTE|nr:uncharacterized protein GSPATT00020415001 [Paramecium tetraurelia]CAK86743.1 unnamed protein product [Paramecium tetraurelia]|eukprot:XP_001454140.1 hypothetical protein (macronuclear) [Paramecium tetraurelia strain d4-2]
MSNLILKLRCKEHKKNKIIGKCDNNTCSKDPLFCIDCLAQDYHQNHLEDTTNFGDLEFILKEILLQWSIKNRITKSVNSKSEISEVQLDEETNQLILINNQIQYIESNDLQLNQENDQLQEIQNQETLIQEKIECGQCHQIQEISQYVNDEKNGISNNCLDQKCSKCQSSFNYPLKKIENKNYCTECIKCHECNRQEPRRSVGSFFYHEDGFLQISKNSELKKVMIAYIKKYFGTKIKKGDNNTQIYFLSESYPCLALEDYSGYIIGYNHPIIKSKLQIDPKTYIITEEQANIYLIEDLDQYERELYEFYLRQGRKPEDIPENVRMLLLFVLFIFKDFSSVLNLVQQKTYRHLYNDITKYQYPKQNSVSFLKGKVEKALDSLVIVFIEKMEVLEKQLLLISLRKFYLPIKESEYYSNDLIYNQHQIIYLLLTFLNARSIHSSIMLIFNYLNQLTLSSMYIIFIMNIFTHNNRIYDSSKSPQNQKI